jgi:hypothetical protein
MILTTAERRSTFFVGKPVLSLLCHRFIRFALGATWRFQRAKYLDERAKGEIISNRLATSSTLHRLACSNEWTSCMFPRSFPRAHLFLNCWIVNFSGVIKSAIPSNGGLNFLDVKHYFAELWLFDLCSRFRIQALSFGSRGSYFSLQS